MRAVRAADHTLIIAVDVKRFYSVMLYRGTL